MIVWNNYLVVIRPRDVQIYTMPSSSSSSEPPSHLQTLPFGRMVWEAVILSNSNLVASLRGLFPKRSENDKDDKISFLISSESKVHLYNLSLDGLLAEESSTTGFILESIVHSNWKGTSWCLSAGATGCRLSWLSQSPRVEGNWVPPAIFMSTLNQHFTLPTGIDNTHHLLIGTEINIADADRLPATWAMPKLEFDEALGLLAIGNTFGELAICDYVKQSTDQLGDFASEPSWKIAEDFDISIKVCTSRTLGSII
jgi:hypothetical protein